MAIPQLDQSLCGCSLKTGSKIIGWFSLISNILQTIGYIVDYTDMKKDKSSKQAALNMKLILIFVYAILTLFAGMLLYGVYKSRPGYMLAWIIIETVSYIIVLIAVFTVLFSVGFSAPLVITTAILLIITGYILLVVYSHYRELSGGSGFGV